MSEEKIMQRESNIELLRIILVCFVIVLHFNHPSIGGGFAYAEGAKKIILFYIESVCVCSVDLFILISGFYLSRRVQRNLWRPVQLIVQVILFSLAEYFISIVFGKNEFSLMGFGGRLLPCNYFVILYSSIYLLSPVLNDAMLQWEPRRAKFFLLLSVFLLSVYPTAVDMLQEMTHHSLEGLSSVGREGSQQGYTLANFALMYFIGAYMNFFEDSLRKEKVWCLLLKFLLTSGILTGMAYLDLILGYEIGAAWEYCNPLVVYNAILLFRIFKSFQIKENSIINRLAKAVFTVFLIQGSFVRFAPTEQILNYNIIQMCFSIILLTSILYFAGWIIYLLYDMITKNVFHFLSGKFKLKY